MREIAVLNGQIRERGGLTGGESGVQLHQFVQQHPFGPAVKDDMVSGYQQPVLSILQPQQRGPEQWSPAQIERAMSFRTRDIHRFRLPGVSGPLRKIPDFKFRAQGLG